MSDSRSAPGTFPVSVPFALDAAGNSITIPFTETVIAGNTGKARPRADPTVCRLHLYAGVDNESNLSACGFYAKRNGHYIAEISTIEPMPAFKGVATTVRVDDYYNTG